MSLDLINNYILENKELIRKYICQKSKSNCSFYITKGKYKNNVCGRKCFTMYYCKVHSKHIVESKKIAENTFHGIELKEFLYKKEKFLKTEDNIVYSNFDKGYFPVGDYDQDNDIIIYYK